MKSMQHSLTHKNIPCLHGYYYRKGTVGGKQYRDRAEQLGKGKGGGIARPAPALIRRKRVLGVVRRVTQDEFVFFHITKGKITDISQKEPNPVSEGTLQGIFVCLLYAGGIYVNTHNSNRGASLRNHQRNEAATTPYVQNASLRTGQAHPRICPCPKQHRIGAHRHGTPVVADLEFLEPKCFSCHNRETNLLLFAQQGTILRKKRDKAGSLFRF